MCLYILGTWKKIAYLTNPCSVGTQKIHLNLPIYEAK